MRVLLTGAGGMLGSAFVRRFQAQRPEVEVVAATRATADLLDPAAVSALFRQVRPDAVVHTAARVAGIAEKLSAPADFLLDNLRIDTTVIGSAIRAEVPELLYISSGAVYPAETAQPIPEEALLTGALESANEGYALAKIAGGKLCEYASRQYGYAYRTAAPSNLYGPGDDFREGRAHLVAATIAKMQSAVDSGADAVTVWGDGTARREFTFSDDLAGWLVTQLGGLEAWPALVNVGAGEDHSIREYYDEAAAVTGFTGRLEYDETKPSGVPRRLLDSSRAIELGWRPQTSLAEGYAATHRTYLADREKN